MIEFRGISWRSGAFALENISLSVSAHFYGVLMGRTGSGKTTLLEILCGLRKPHAGSVFINGRDVTDEPPAARKIGYVPQDGALFPTMTVAEQIAFAPQVQRWAPHEIQQRVDELSADLGIRDLLDRMPDALSGGERQRVALGRALAARPKVLVLDEPLASLDEESRDELAELLLRIQKDQCITALHVTHSRTEAGRLADVLFILSGGRITSA